MVRKAGKQDLEILANLAVQMWDSHSVDELIAEFSEIISKGKAQFFLKYENDAPIGFAQCQLRYDYVEGTKTSPVGYLEIGLFALPRRCKFLWYLYCVSPVLLLLMTVNKIRYIETDGSV